MRLFESVLVSYGRSIFIPLRNSHIDKLRYEAYNRVISNKLDMR